MSIVSLMPNSSSSAVAADSGARSLHYKPLNGGSLREIARAKEHHNSGGFVNPIGLGRDGRFWEVMKWKLFSENKFKKFFADEQVIPVTIDWEPIREHSDSSVTFLKHASVMIKDVDRYILVDPIISEIFWFMAPSHMNPRETVQVFKKLKAAKMMIVHWGTFRLGNEPVHFPPMQVKEELKKEGLRDRLVDLKHGETLFLDS